MSYGYREKDTIYRCSVCCKLLCTEHVKLATVCFSFAKKTKLAFTMHKVMALRMKWFRLSRFTKSFTYGICSSCLSISARR